MLSDLLPVLPLPAAQAMRRALTAGNPSERRRQACAAAEILLKLAACVRIAACARYAGPLNASLSQMLETLGLSSSEAWAAALREFSLFLSLRTDVKSIPLGAYAELVKPRGEWKGVAEFFRAAQAAGFLPPEAVQAALDEGALGCLCAVGTCLDQWKNSSALPGFTDGGAPETLLLNALGDAARHPALLGGGRLAVGRPLTDRAGVRTGFEWRILAGLGGLPDDGPTDARLDSACVPGHVHLYGPGLRLDLHPLVVFHEDDAGMEQVGILNRIHPKDQEDGIEKWVYWDPMRDREIQGLDSDEGPAWIASLKEQNAKHAAGEDDRSSHWIAGPAVREQGLMGGRYRLQERLGAGGMGEVWKAQDQQELRSVALKLLFKSDAGQRFRFIREYLALKRLSHPGVVSVFDFHEEDDRCFYTMELIAGPTLKDYLLKGDWCGGQRAPHYFADADGLATALSLSLEALAVLGYLHAQGIIHRDVKPQNFLVRREDRQVKVVDFGLVREAGQDMLSATRAIQGTPSYLSPEQISGKAIDARADLYAFGVMLYELLTGDVPFHGRDMVDLMMHHLNTFPAPPKGRNPKISEPMQAVILKLLAKQPSLRYGTAAEAYQSLREAAQTMRFTEDSEVLTTELHVTTDRITPPHDLLIAPWVGNAKALPALEEGLHALLSRQGRVFLIQGLFGTGKTRLLEETREAAVLKGVKCYHGAAREGLNLPYQVFQDVVRQLHREEPDLIRLHLRALAPAFPFLAGESEVKPSEDPQENRARLFAAFFEIFQTLTQKRNVLLLADDLHGADKPSLDLFSHLVYSFTGDDPFAGTPLMLAGAFREEAEDQTPAFKGWLQDFPSKRHQRIPLGPFTLEETGRFIQYVLARPCPPRPAFVQRIHEATGGNPCGIAETLQAMMAEGGWFRKGEQEDALEMGELIRATRTTIVSPLLPVPRGIKEAIQHRLNKYGERDLEILKTAALLGREIRLSLLKETLNLEEEDLLLFTDRLLRDKLWIELGGEAYGFLHDQWRAAILSDATTPWKKLVHSKIARAYGSLYKEVPPSAAGVLAWHLEEAGRPGEALPLYTSAARHAQENFQNEEALGFWEKVAELADSRGEKARACGAMGDLCEVIADYPTGETCFDRAIELADPESEEAVHWMNRKAYLISKKGDFPAVLALAEDAERRARALGCAKEASYAAGRLHGAQTYIGRHAEGVVWGEKAIRYAEEAGDERARMVGYANIVVSYFILGRQEEADAYLEKARLLAEHRNDLRHILIQKTNLAVLMAQEIRAQWLLGQGCQRLAESCRDLGDHALSLEHFAKADAIFASIQSDYRKVNLHQWGLALVLAGEREEGMAKILQAMAEIRSEQVEYFDAAEACLSLARARELLGSGAKARAAAQLALQIAEKHGYEGIARRARAIMGRLEPQ